MKVRLVCLKQGASNTALYLMSLVLLLATGCSGGGSATDSNANAPAAPAASATGSATDSAGAAAPAELPPPVEAYPPVPWTVPPGGLPEGPPMADVITIGDLGGTAGSADQRVYLFAGCRDRYLMTDQYFDRKARTGSGIINRMLYGQFDPATGKPVGQPIPLGEEYYGDYGFKTFQGRIADVSPSGVLAIQIWGKDPATAGKMSVLAPKEQAPRLLPDIPPVRWFAWTAKNRILVLHEGKLRLWALGNTPELSFGEKLDLPIAISPARNWVLAAVDQKYLEVYDTATGEVLGRVGPEGRWKELAVSPDGKQLAAVRHAGPMPENSSTLPLDRYDIHTWDLTTGKPAVHVLLPRQTAGPPISWAGPNHVYYSQRVIDLNTRMEVVELQLPGLGPSKGDFRDPMATNETRAVASPDGRRWWTANISQTFAAPIPLEPPGGKKAFDEKTPVKLEVKGADPARDVQVKEAITKALTSSGRPIGESPWTFRVTINVGESGFELFDKQQTFTPPKVDGFAELIPPGEKEGLATIPFSGEFSRENSAYLVRTKKNDPLAPMTTTYTYDFRGQDPRQAILQECWDKVLKTLGSIRTLPSVWEVNGKFQPLPVAVALQPPPGVPASGDGDKTK